MRPYQASLFAMHQRLKETGVLRIAHHLLLICPRPGVNEGSAVVHHAVMVRTMNCTEIDDAVANKGFHLYVFYKVALLKLTSYAKVLHVDLDVYMTADISGVFAYPTPGMVRWESNNHGPFQANSAVMLVKPSMALYDAALGHLQRLPTGTMKSRVKRLYDMITPWGAFHNSTTAQPAVPGLVLAGDGDQQFFFMLFNVLERERFGPLNELPYAYNVKSYMLTFRQFRSWTSKAFLTFMSRPEQGHIRAVHFNRDKPWEGAQCGPFQPEFWRAAQRAIAELDASPSPSSHVAFYKELLDGSSRLRDYVAESLAHETRQPCVRGARTESLFTKTYGYSRSHQPKGVINPGG